MCKLEGSWVYLVGAIDLSGDLGAPWREEITPFLKKQLKCKVINPLCKPVNIGLESNDNRPQRAKLKLEEDYDKFSDIMKAIRSVDLRFVDRADFVIWYLDLDHPTFGSVEEAAWANREKKPVLVVCPQGKQAIPDWVFGMLPHRYFYNNFEELKSYLLDVDTIGSTDSRWVFFDWDLVTEDNDN